MDDSSGPHIPQTLPRFSATFDPHAIAEIQRAAATGIYDIRGGGTKRKLPHFDDLLFLGASISRYPLEGYREKCGTDVIIGARHAKKPIHLKIPITIAGMSFGSLSGNAKEALGRGASAMGTSDANGQFEMNWEYDHALVTADRHSFFKFMVKSIAENHGLRGSGATGHARLMKRGPQP